MTQLQDTLDDLLELQTLDSELARLKKAQGALDNGNKAGADASRLRGDYDRENSQLHRLSGDLKDCELQLQGVETKLTLNKDRLYKGVVTNPKEMVNIEREIGSLTRQRSDLDGKILGLMEQVERQRELTEAADEKAKVAEHSHSTAQLEFRSRYDSLNTEISGLTRRRSELANCIGPNPLLKRYDDIRARHNGVGIAKINGTTCSGCGMPVASSVVKTVRDGESAVTCENCGRLLAIQ